MKKNIKGIKKAPKLYRDVMTNLGDKLRKIASDENPKEEKNALAIIKSDKEYLTLSSTMKAMVKYSSEYRAKDIRTVNEGARSLKQIDDLRSKVKQKQDFFINPLKEQQSLLKKHIQEINSLFEPMLTPLNDSETIIETEILRFKEAEKKRHEEKVKEAEKEIMKELEKQAKQEDKKPHDDIDSLFVSSKGEDFEFVSPTPAPSIPLPSAPSTAQKTIHTSAGTLTTRYDVSVEILDLKELAQAVVNPGSNLPIEILKPNIGLLEDLVRDGREEIPGCKISRKPSLQRRTR